MLLNTAAILFLAQGRCFGQVYYNRIVKDYHKLKQKWNQTDSKHERTLSDLWRACWGQISEIGGRLDQIKSDYNVLGTIDKMLALMVQEKSIYHYIG